MKTCSLCKESFADELFQMRGNGVRRKDCKLCQKKRAAEFRERNKEKLTLYRKEYYVENEDRLKEYKKKWCEANKETLSAKRKEHYETNKKQLFKYRAEWAKKNKEKQAEYNRTWRKNNPSVSNAIVAKRRAAIKTTVPVWADQEYMRDLYANCREAEAVFGKAGLNVKFHVDHIVPLKGKTVCGLHCEDNLQILNATENMSKNNRYWPDMP